MAKPISVPFAGREGTCLFCGHGGGLSTEFAELLGATVRYDSHSWCKRETLDANKGSIPDDKFPPDAREALKPKRIFGGGNA